MGINNIKHFAKMSAVLPGYEGKKASMIFRELVTGYHREMLLNSGTYVTISKVRNLGKTTSKKACENMFEKLFGDC